MMAKDFIEEKQLIFRVPNLCYFWDTPKIIDSIPRSHFHRQQAVVNSFLAVAAVMSHCRICLQGGPYQL